MPVRAVVEDDKPKFKLDLFGRKIPTSHVQNQPTRQESQPVLSVPAAQPVRPQPVQPVQTEPFKQEIKPGAEVAVRPLLFFFFFFR